MLYCFADLYPIVNLAWAALKCHIAFDDSFFGAICNLRMSNVDIFATGPAEQSLWWEEISLKAMTLDIADFLDNSYSVPTFGGPGTSPCLLKQKLKSNQSSLLSQQKRRPISHSMDTDSDSEEEEEDEDEEGEQEGYGEEETEDQGPEGLDEMPTPTSRPSKDILGLSGSSMLPPSSKTPKTPLMARPPQKKWKRDSMASIAKQLADITQQNAASLAKIQMQAELAKQQTDLALAQIREDNAKERLANIELHRANQNSCGRSREQIESYLRRTGKCCRSCW